MSMVYFLRAQVKISIGKKRGFICIHETFLTFQLFIQKHRLKNDKMQNCCHKKKSGSPLFCHTYTENYLSLISLKDLSYTINRLILRFWLLLLPFYIDNRTVSVDFTVSLLILPFYCWIQQYKMVTLQWNRKINKCTV
jgi:hypothetical protein